MMFETKITDDQASALNHYMLSKYGFDSRFDLQVLKLDSNFFVTVSTPLILEKGILYVE